MKTILTSILMLGTATAGVAAEATPSTNSVRLTPDYLSQLAEEMRTNSPVLQAAYARTNAAHAEIGAVRTWEDPMLRLGGLAAREEMRADEGDIIYGVEQKLPLFGKPGLARGVARSGLATEVANTEYQFQTLRRELAKVAFQVALADQIVTIGEQDLAWLNTVGEALPGRYRAGQATLVDLLQVDNERARRATQLKTDRDQLGHQRVSLNRLLNRDLSAPWPTLELPPLAGPVVFNQQLVDFAMKYEPKVQMMRRQIQQAEAAAALTRRERLPDVNVGVEARNYSGNGTFRQAMFVLSMNLPLANAGKYRSDLKRDEAKVKATEFDLADYEWAVREDVHRLTVKIESARREALLYRDEIIPRTTTALESARTGWEGNQNPFRDVLDARRMLLEARLMYARAVAEQYEMLSELVLCCGLGDLNALQMIGAEPRSTSEGQTNEK